MQQLFLSWGPWGWNSGSSGSRAFCFSHCHGMGRAPRLFCMLYALSSAFPVVYTRLILSGNAGQFYKQVQNRLHFFFSALTESGCHDTEKTTTNAISFVIQLILIAPSCGRKKNSPNFPLLITYSRTN